MRDTGSSSQGIYFSFDKKFKLDQLAEEGDYRIIVELPPQDFHYAPPRFKVGIEKGKTTVEHLIDKLSDILGLFYSKNYWDFFKKGDGGKIALDRKSLLSDHVNESETIYFYPKIKIG